MNVDLSGIARDIDDLAARLRRLEVQEKPGNFTTGSVLFGGSDGRITQDNASIFWDDTNNRLGIGTAAPEKKLHIASGSLGDSLYMSYSAPNFLLGNNAVFSSATMYGLFAMATGAGHYGLAAGDVLVAAYGNSRGNLYLNSNYSGTGTTNLIMQPSSGSVGIGGAPTTKLHVIDAAAAAQDIQSSSTTGYSRLRFVTNTRTFGWVTEGSAGTSFPGQLALYDYTATALRMLILANGNIGIGGISPTKLLELATDSAGKPTTNTWQIISDERTKRGVKLYKEGFNLIRQINPVHFEYNGKGGTPEGDSGVGVLAQEIEKFAPQMVRRVRVKVDDDDDERLEYQGNEVQYAMINAMKEAFERIEKLEAKAGKEIKP